MSNGFASFRVRCVVRFAAQSAAVALFFSVFPPTSFAGPVNPDISAIGDMRAQYSDATEEVALGLEEVEVSLVGALNPYATGTFTLGITEEEGIDIEEGKLSLDRYFPGGFGLTAGKYLVDFGQLNQIHAHAYPFLDRPLMHQAFFGEEGAKDAGVRLDWIAPTEGVSIRAAAAAVRGVAILGPEDDQPVTEEGVPQTETVGATGRLDFFFEPSPSVSILIGGSVLTGEYVPDENARATWLGPDLKARFDLGPQRSLVVNAEAMFGDLDETADAPSASPNGWFASADLRATKRWNVGGFAESTTGRQDDTVRTNRAGGFIGFGLLEESTLFRLVGRITDPDEGESETEVLAQAIFALGPHQAHRY